MESPWTSPKFCQDGGRLQEVDTLGKQKGFQQFQYYSTCILNIYPSLFLSLSLYAYYMYVM